MEFEAFIGGFNVSQSYSQDQERTVNLYPEKSESQGAASRAALYPTPGVTQISAAASGPGRGHLYIGGREFAVFNTSFSEIDVFGTITNRGTVESGANPATLSYNGDGGGEILVTSGNRAYIFDLATNAFTEIAALFGKAHRGAQLDGYFIVLDAAASKFYISDLLDGLTWQTGLKFAQRSQAPDPWKAMEVVGRYIWLVGEQTSEVWYDSGSFPFPFAPHPSGLIQYGISAAFSLRSAEGTLCWLGCSSAGDRYVLKASGFNAEKISTAALENAFRAYNSVVDAQADIYSDRGHLFYLLHFPIENATWAYDLNTGIWCERGTWVPALNRYVTWRPRWHAQAFGEHRILDASTGSLYRMSSDIGTDVDGLAIRRLRRAPVLATGQDAGAQAELIPNQRLFHASYELAMETGLGNAVAPGDDPRVMLRYSNDGGRTFGSELWRSAGKAGDYMRLVIWNRMGQARQRVVEISFTDVTPFRLTAFYVNLAQPVRAVSRVQVVAAIVFGLVLGALAVWRW